MTPHFSLSLPIVLAEASTSGKEADQNCENIALLLSSSPTELRPSPAGHATNHSIEGHPARDDFTESCSDTLEEIVLAVETHLQVAYCQLTFNRLQCICTCTGTG